MITAKPLQEFTRVTRMNVGQLKVAAKLQFWPSESSGRWL